ncbi:hypothetical protein B0T25DRAFT_621034 [Lasiosphaeria hispida]|uniref:FAS1 domain-containing protein n=1 Tax=Lasiosphaeria hispida TaxID=260671 RepID=A0AAJ0HQX6_9PEZI|nr:hypothetical protein B0T25DRAFT_621034 [Lasiosphaeria hispida]
MYSDDIVKLPPIGLLALQSGVEYLAISRSTLHSAASVSAENATLSILNGFLQQRQARVTSKLGPNFLPALLSYHVLNGTYYSSNFTNTSDPLFTRTLLNSTSYSSVTGGQRIEARNDKGNANFYSGSQNSAQVQTTEFNFTGGTIHIIDSMLTIPSNLTATLLEANLTAAVGALQQSGIADSLDAASELTVFAPSNHAFDVVGSLVADMAPGGLDKVPGYHAVPGWVLYSDLIGNSSTATTAKIVVRGMLIANGINTGAVPNLTALTQSPAFTGTSATGGSRLRRE